MCPQWFPGHNCYNLRLSINKFLKTNFCRLYGKNTMQISSTRMVTVLKMMRICREKVSVQVREYERYRKHSEANYSTETLTEEP